MKLFNQGTDSMLENAKELERQYAQLVTEKEQLENKPTTPQIEEKIDDVLTQMEEVVGKIIEKINLIQTS